EVEQRAAVAEERPAGRVLLLGGVGEEKRAELPHCLVLEPAPERPIEEIDRCRGRHEADALEFPAESGQTVDYVAVDDRARRVADEMQARWRLREPRRLHRALVEDTPTALRNPRNAVRVLLHLTPDDRPGRRQEPLQPAVPEPLELIDEPAPPPGLVPDEGGQPVPHGRPEVRLPH